eukprot:4893-Heterococcus_DN1.PRE.1
MSAPLSRRQLAMSAVSASIKGVQPSVVIARLTSAPASSSCFTKHKPRAAASLPCHRARRCSDRASAAKHLQDHSVDELNAEGGTLLHVACGPDVEHLSKGSDTLIKQLLQAGADPNARTAAPGHTALMLSRSSAVANCLLNNGADIELKTDDGCVALHVACANGLRYEFPDEYVDCFHYYCSVVLNVVLPLLLLATVPLFGLLLCAAISADLCCYVVCLMLQCMRGYAAVYTSQRGSLHVLVHAHNMCCHELALESAYVR